MHFNAKWANFIVYFLAKMLQLTAMPIVESYLPAPYIPVFFFMIFVITTNCANTHVDVIGSLTLLYRVRQK